MRTTPVLVALSCACLGIGCGDGERRLPPGDGGPDAKGSPDLPLAADLSTTEAQSPALDAADAAQANGDALPDTPPIDGGPLDAGPPVDGVPAVDGDGLDTGVLVDGSVDAAACTVLPARFDQDTVLPRGCYLAQKTPILAASVRLTLSPGVTILFSADTGLSFSGNQVLSAIGTAADPILLTGVQPQRGYWKGISFDGTLTPDSAFDHVTVEYAGQTKSDKDGAAIKLTADSRGVRASITNTVIRESQGWGLYLGGSAVVAAFSGNTLTKNTLGPACVSSELAGVLDPASTYRGNDRDQVVVQAQYVSKPATWAALDVPYYIDSGLRTAVDWTIAPGTTLIAAKDVAIQISGDGGALIANGTEDEPILFTAADKTRGAWAGLIFDNSNNTRSSLSHVTVEYAGNTKSDRDAAAVKLIADSHGTQVKISNTTLRQSQGFGLYLTGSAIVPEFTGNVLTQNQLGPARVGSTAAHQLLPASSYVGNDLDQVFVHSDYVAKPVTWQDLGVPYMLDGNITVQDVWTLAPGVVLLMAGGSIMVGGDDSGLHAVGTAAAPILISGVDKSAGSWESIVFDTTLNGANAFDYCTIEYGGGGTSKGYKGMILAKSDSHGAAFSLTNSTVRHSAVYGVWLSHYANATMTDNTFSDNAMGDTFHEP